MSSKDRANQILLTIDAYFPQYLFEIGLQAQHPIVKVAFYESMIEALPMMGIGDDKAQVMVEVALRRSIMNLRTVVALAVRNKDIPPQ